MKKSLTLGTLLPSINKAFGSANNKSMLRGAIIEHIQTGKSPVAGKRFKQYSESYANKKGVSRKPVDMTVTGKMLSSLVVSMGNPRSMRVYFRSKIASYHDSLGAGRSKIIRRLIPSKKGERFAKGLENLISSMINKAVDKAVKKQNN